MRLAARASEPVAPHEPRRGREPPGTRARQGPTPGRLGRASMCRPRGLGWLGVVAVLLSARYSHASPARKCGNCTVCVSDGRGSVTSFNTSMLAAYQRSSHDYLAGTNSVSPTCLLAAALREAWRSKPRRWGSLPELQPAASSSCPRLLEPSLTRPTRRRAPERAYLCRAAAGCRPCRGRSSSMAPSVRTAPTSAFAPPLSGESAWPQLSWTRLGSGKPTARLTGTRRCEASPCGRCSPGAPSRPLHRSGQRRSPPWCPSTPPVAPARFARAPLGECGWACGVTPPTTGSQPARPPWPPLRGAAPRPRPPSTELPAGTTRVPRRSQRTHAQWWSTGGPRTCANPFRQCKSPDWWR